MNEKHDAQGPHAVRQTTLDHGRHQVQHLVSPQNTAIAHQSHHAARTDVIADFPEVTQK
ncbi:hypothetical protein [Streptomyces sp900116325]|uniref:hypothetical protein n=1 Tax=Streptomyces sp. 900116325 TaxID=3154295 RepID=UPI0033E48A16